MNAHCAAAVYAVRTCQFISLSTARERFGFTRNMRLKSRERHVSGHRRAFDLPRIPMRLWRLRAGTVLQADAALVALEPPQIIRALSVSDADGWFALTHDC